MQLRAPAIGIEVSDGGRVRVNSRLGLFRLDNSAKRALYEGERHFEPE
jgi:hypothetical protein